MKDIFKHLLMFLVVIGAVLILAPKLRHAMDSRVTTVVIRGVNTSAFNEGNIVALDEYGSIRVTFPRDSSSTVLGIVTRCDSIGEITLKYIPNE